MENSFLSIPCLTLQGQIVTPAEYNARVFLIVNTASQCHFTPQYAELENLWQRYQPAGLLVMGFPCNQFGKQEPSNDSEIAQFCTQNYGVTFPMFSKINVNGGDSHPLFQYLKQAAPGVLGSRDIKWNFTKFLVNHNGNKVYRFAPISNTKTLNNKIRMLLESN